MPKVRATKDLYHGAGKVAQRRRKGEVFEITQAQLDYAAKRYKEKKIVPPFELVPERKAPAQDLESIA